MAGDEGKDEKIIKTSIDSLMDFIKNKGAAIDISEAATSLGITESIAEQWAKVLEEANLIKISYRVGKMFVEPVQLSAAETKIVTTKIDTRRDMLEEEVSVQLKQLDKIGDIIDAAKISASNAEEVFKQKAPEMQQRLNELNKVYENVNAQYNYIESASKKIDEINDRINKGLSSTLSKIEMYSSLDVVKNIEEVQSKIGEALRSAGEVNGELNTVLKERDKAIDDIRKGLNAQIESLKKQLDSAISDLNQRVKLAVEQVKEEERELEAQESALKKASQEMAQFNKEKAEYEKEINGAKAAFNDQYSTRKQEMSRNIAAFENELKGFNAKIEEMKSAFGDVANIFDSINTAKKELAEASEKLSSAKADAQELYEMVKALSVATSMAPDKKLKELNDLSNRSQELGHKIDSIKEGITKAAGSIRSKKGRDNA
ncbi:MAG: hypothetical protein QXK65_02915 [Candidatus Micrarchaeaceae archaeon]